MLPVQTPPQLVPVLDNAGLAARIWYLFWDAAKAAINDLLANAVYGKPALVDVGRIPKVVSAGTLGESAMTDDGATVSSTEPIKVNVTSPVQASQVQLRAAGLGALDFLSYAADNQEILLDCYFDPTGPTYVATSTSAARIMKFNGQYRITGKAGLVVGSPFAFGTDSQNIDLTTGYTRVGSTTVAAYPLDVTGDVNTTGVYRVAGTQVVGSRKAALTAATGAVVGTAGAAYTATEQGLINSLITLTTNLRTRVNELENRLASASGHGLIT